MNRGTSPREKKRGDNRLLPTLEALLVTFLWSSSYVFIKLGLLEMTPWLFAAVRYSLAFTILLFALITAERPRKASKIDWRTWASLAIMGLVGYTLAQGLQFVGLSYLPAVATTFLLNFTPIFVLILGILFLGEVPTMIQLLGMVVSFAGAYFYFFSHTSIPNAIGISMALASGWAWATYMVMMRGFQKTKRIGSLRLTTITMGFGCLGLGIFAGALEGFRSISFSNWMIILWLSLVNTALAFYLWNRALKSLRAYELSILQNTMLIQIALLAWAFLGEEITPSMAVGIILVLLGVTLVQVRK